jgi:hypothetical protein
MNEFLKVWMGSAEIAMIQRYLKPCHVMLEWGAGGSTLFYSQFVQAYFSIEHDPKWFQSVAKELQRLCMAQVKLYHKPVVRSALSRRESFRAYIDLPRSFERKFDRILIDGRERVACAEVAYDLIAEDGVLFVHDYVSRPRYAPIEQKWRIIDRVDHGPSLAVFQMKMVMQ